MSSTSKPTVFVCYGFCEGPHIGRYFLQALEQANFQLIDDPKQADILIGHSGGCMLVSTSGPTQLTVFIGFPYWPGRSLLYTLFKKNRHEYMVSRRNGTSKAWWAKLRWNSLYFWNMRRNLSMQRAMRRGPQVPTGQPLCIRNRGDDCCIPEIWRTSSLEKCVFVSVPGEHDHLWMHPEVYTAIIKAYYGTNVLASPKTE
jgi:hypothetical protein